MQSPMSPRMKQHQQYYQNVRGHSSSWKENFRKKCLLRVRDSRAKLVEKFRQSGDGSASGPALTHRQVALALMEGEWGGSLHQHMKDGKGDEQETMLAILEEVEKEMKICSERLADDVAKFEQGDVEHLVNKCQDLEVICPICQVCALEMREQQFTAIAPGHHQVVPQAVACRCGLLLSNVTLKHVESNLQQTISLHNIDCQQSLSFTATTEPASVQQSFYPTSAPFGSTQSIADSFVTSNVLATCSSCEWMSFLL